MHVNPTQQKSWDPHGLNAWNIGHSMEHYRCYKVYVSKTKVERITNTLTFKPHLIPVQHFSLADNLITAAQEIQRHYRYFKNRKPKQWQRCNTLPFFFNIQ